MKGFEDPIVPDWRTSGVTPIVLRKKEAHIWRVDLTSSVDLGALMFSNLSDNEKHRARQFKQEVHASQYVIAHLALRDILSGYLLVRPKDIIFDTGPHGKPVLRQGMLDFNLSHSEKVAVVAIAGSDIGPVGVDVESLARRCEELMLAKRFFSDREYQVLRALPSESLLEGFFATWTLKEAWVKAMGVGLSESLRCFDVSLSDNQQGFVRCDPSLSQHDSWQLQRFWVDKGHVGALATLYPSDFIKYFNFCDAGVVS